MRNVLMVRSAIAFGLSMAGCRNPDRVPTEDTARAAKVAFRVNAGAMTEYVDGNGRTWAADQSFSVSLNGKPVMRDLDVLREAGGFAKPLVKECIGIAVTDGVLLIEFTPNVQNPEINGIEVLAE